MYYLFFGFSTQALKQEKDGADPTDGLSFNWENWKMKTDLCLQWQDFLERNYSIFN